MEKIQLDSILLDELSPRNLTLKEGDKLTLFTSASIIDDAGKNVAVIGAVRAPRVFPYDFENDFTVENLVTLSGGLKRGCIGYCVYT